MPLPTNICVLYNLNGSSEFSLPLLSEQLVAHINMCGSMVNTFAVMSLCMERNESWGFLIALMAILMMALVQAIWECANLGFLEAFPSECLVGLSQALASRGSQGCFLGMCRAIRFSNPQVFLIFIPLLRPYFMSFLWVYRKGKGGVNLLSMKF